MNHPESLSVLLVEDDPTDTALFRALLGHTPSFEQRHADCLADAITLVGSEEIGAVVLDLGLPDSDPSETYVRLRDAAPLVPVIVLTGHDDDSLALDALAQGAQDFLVKTEVTEALLAKAIRYAVERQRAVARQMRQRVQELEAFESLAPVALSGDESGLASSSPDEFDDLVLTYDHLLGRAVEVTDEAGAAELSAGLDGLAIRLATLRATPPDLAIVHASALSKRQTDLGPEEFRTHEDAARLLLLRLTGALANRYRGTVELDAVSGPGDVDQLRKEFAHQLQTARSVLAADRWPEASLDELMQGLVQSLVELWQGARSTTARAMASAATGADAAHDLRYVYLRELVDRSIELLGRNIDLADEDLRRPTVLALAELFAVLDQKLLLGDLYPNEQSKDQGIRELAERTLARLPLLQAFGGTMAPPLAPQPPPARARAEPPPSPASAPSEAATPPAAAAGAGGRRLTEADYAAWANRMRSRRREEILSNLEPEPVEEEPKRGWDPDALFRDSD